MAYLNHDLEDAIRSGVIRAEQVPGDCTKILGSTHSERATTMIRDLISTTEVCDDKLRLQMSEDVNAAMSLLRKFLYEKVYRSPHVHKHFEKAKKILSELYTYFLDNEQMLLENLAELQMTGCNHNNQTRERIVCDLIASMTDRYAMNLYKKLFFPIPVM
jgi:dGTPase